MDDIAIKVDSVSKSFKLPHEKNSSVKSALINFSGKPKRYEIQKALQDISFEVKQGEFFGIIGRNGSGKSTLLKLLAGIYSPTSGNVHVNGNLTPFIELGVGFNPELTGRENVYLNGALLGFNRKEMQDMYKDIVEFAELQKFMDQKLKNYSSGMQVRLAFSIAIRARSDILLIDEVLAVGDENFQKKCFEIFEKLKREGRTIIFVSHAMSTVRDFCDRVALINKGKLVAEGHVDSVINQYHILNRQNEEVRLSGQNSGKIKFADEDIRSITGNRKVEVTQCKVFDHENKETFNLESGKEMTIKLKVKFLDDIEHPVYAVMFRKDPQENLLGIHNSFGGGKKPRAQKKGSEISIEFKTTLQLAPNNYYLTIAISDQEQRPNYTDLIILNNYLRLNVYGEDVWGLVKNDGTIHVS